MRRFYGETAQAVDLRRLITADYGPSRLNAWPDDSPFGEYAGRLCSYIENGKTRTEG
jgi:hypothetical protein